ncbi:MAG: DUF2093 domain-containing protein [Hyphomicrobiaceae bacterium]
MNRVDRLFGFKGEARVKYLDSDYQVLAPGDFVRCAVSGQPIPLSDLKYWNVDHQEPYASAELSVQRYQELREGGASESGAGKG